MKLHHFFIIVALMLPSCYQFLTPDFTAEDLKLVQWAEKGKNLVFVSNQQDTVKYLITGIEYKKSSGAGIRGWYYDYYQSVLYSGGTMLVIYKNSPNRSPEINIYFGGVDEWSYSGITTSGYNDFGTDTIINHLSYNDVWVIDNPKGKTQITKLIWSKHHGPLEYHTKDGRVWIRQNVNPNAIYPEVHTPPLSWSEIILNFLGENMLLIFIVLVIVLIFYKKRNKKRTKKPTHTPQRTATTSTARIYTPTPNTQATPKKQEPRPISVHDIEKKSQQQTVEELLGYVLSFPLTNEVKEKIQSIQRNYQTAKYMKLYPENELNRMTKQQIINALK